MQDADDNIVTTNNKGLTTMPAIPDVDPLKPTLDAPRTNQQGILAKSIKARLLGGIVTVLDKTYNVTRNDINSQYANFSFAHGLDYTPVVFGTVTAGGVTKELTALYYDADSSYFAGSPPSFININGINSSNIVMALKITDAIGLSFFSSNRQLNFTFYCVNPNSF